jgi:predicted dehydrogenase
MLLLGPPTLKGQAVAHFDTPGGAEDMLQAVWTTDSGKVAVSGVVGGDRNDIISYRILGTNGCLRFDNWYNLLHETRDGSDSVLDADQQLPASAYKGQLDQLAIQYDTNKQQLATFDDALAVQKLIEKMIA